MNVNNILLLHFLSKEAWASFRKYIVVPAEHKELTAVYKVLDDFWDSDTDRASITLQELEVMVAHQLGDENAATLVLGPLKDYSIGEDILHDLVEASKERQEAMEIALHAIDVSEGKKSFDSLLTKVKEHDTIDVCNDEFVTDNLEELYNHAVKQSGLRWRLRTLNEMLGSLRRGDFGFLFARPETGKTTFLASEVSFFAEQTESPLLWFNNEEQGDKVQLRIIQASLGLTLDELFSARTENQKRYLERTGGRIRLVDRATLYRRDVEKLCKQYKPGLIVFDQLDKVKGFEADREDLLLGAKYQWARELAKDFCPVIAVSQADGSGEGKKWLTMENVANAKTSKQAEADFILGIGKTNQDGFEYIRHLHLCKNKLMGDQDTIPDQRHGRRDVILDPIRARYKDI
jgi:hypothetical protein